MEDERKLTLEERLDRAARSEASSPEIAVMLVRRLAGMAELSWYLEREKPEDPDRPSPEFRALLEENISLERLRLAITAADTAVSDLFLLWVKPYLPMQETPPGDTTNA